MNTYLVQYTYGDSDRMVVLDQHKAYMKELADKGINAVAGAYGPDETSGAMFVFRAEDKPAATALSDKDPFYTGGFVAERTVTEFIPMSGDLMEQVQG